MIPTDYSPPNPFEKKLLRKLFDLKSSFFNSIFPSLIVARESKDLVFSYYTGEHLPITHPRKIGIPLIQYNQLTNKTILFPGSLLFLAPYLKNIANTKTPHFMYGSHLTTQQLHSLVTPSDSPFINVTYNHKIIGIGKHITTKNQRSRIINEISLFSFIHAEKRFHGWKHLL